MSEVFDKYCEKSKECAQLRARVEQMRKAGQAIIRADDEFRESMGRHWDGDPVSDACEAARELFCERYPR